MDAPARSDRSDLTFLYGQSVPRCTHDIDKRFDEYQTLQYMSGGRVDLRIDGELHRLAGSWFWSGFPGPRIAFRCSPGCASWRHRFIAFRGPLVGRWMADGLFPVLPQRPPRGRDFGRRFDELLALLSRTDRWGHRRAIHLIEGILIELAEARVQSNQPDGVTWLAKAIDQLNDRARAEVDSDYSSIAASVGMAESTFRRRFRAATGVPPHVYVLQCRANAARQLLTETDMPVKLIARQLGYQDVFFFTRQFRKFTGVPPALYRKSRHG